MDKLYTRVTEDFDPEAFSGVLVCAENLNDTYGFTQLGYDTCDYGAVPTVYEVNPTVDAYADMQTAIRIGREAGVAIFDTHDDIEAAVSAGTFKGSWAQGDCFCLEENPLNQIVLESAPFRGALEAAGFHAIRDYIVVGNDQPMLTVFWSPSAVELVGPVAVEPIDDDTLHVIRTAEPSLSAKGTPRP